MSERRHGGEVDRIGQGIEQILAHLGELGEAALRPSTPWLLHHTRSPGLKRATPAPVRSTTPAITADDEGEGQVHRHRAPAGCRHRPDRRPPRRPSRPAISRATSKGWLTFGFHRDLNEAWTIAAREMVRLMEELYRLKPKEALSLAGLVAHLSITQAVNGVRGVHAFLPHDAGTVKPGACSSALAREDAVHRARSSLRRESGRRRCRPRRW